jgi:hypothetical protein
MGSTSRISFSKFLDYYSEFQPDFFLPLIFTLITYHFVRDARVAGSIPTQGEKKGYILSRDSEVTLSHWSRSIELVIMPLIDL